MNRILYCIMLLLLMQACKKSEIPFYSGSSDIYFSVINQQSRLSIDTTAITFSYNPERNDSVILLPVRILGPVSPQERAFRCVVIDTAKAAAKAGVHYDLPAAFVIPANAVSTTIRMVLHKTADMQQQNFSVRLQLEANEHFTTNLKYAVIDRVNDRKVFLQQHVVVINDMLSKPPDWLDDYYGVFTAKKLRLMCSILELPLNKFAGPVNSIEISYTRFYANTLKLYLKDMELAGTPVMEEDGSPMKLGKYMQ
ncbi:DUF4843 domain-containing protein [Chitinophaga solisilvae]|uniref:DUF4843 domain-containing protein n=1 Tax=Chitinophaga solisilvae TaxID=1233460 RepID=A0A433WJI0_9BACT|nr:DUF4843 domain-containing protein [Chitinophaga solisilvae]NSL88856.1 DUF4843 domain-containing protein [Chitinophaga solisilvae]